MKIATHALHLVIIASLLAACGGGVSSPPPATAQSHLTATPSSIFVNNLSGPSTQTIAIGGLATVPYGTAAPLSATATDLSFMTLSLQTLSAGGATLNVLLFAAGTSTITVSQGGRSVAIPVSSIGCGKPDILQYAQLVSPASGATNVPLSTSDFVVEIAGLAGLPPVSPFQPTLHAHFVVDGTTTIHPQAPLDGATPPPGAELPVPTPMPDQSVGFESGPMPQLAAGHTYSVYVYSDACEASWKAGSFST